jgi:multiple sugar transport system substrate-binding protein
MISSEGDLELLRVTGQFPRRNGLSEDEYFQDILQQNPHYQVFAKQVNHIRGLDSHERIVEVLDIISQEYEACVIYNRKTPEEAIAEAEKAVNNLLRSN